MQIQLLFSMLPYCWQTCSSFYWWIESDVFRNVLQCFWLVDFVFLFPFFQRLVMTVMMANLSLSPSHPASHWLSLSCHCQCHNASYARKGSFVCLWFVHFTLRLLLHLGTSQPILTADWNVAACEIWCTVQWAKLLL